MATDLGKFDPRRGASNVLNEDALQEVVATAINTAALTRATDGSTDEKPIKVQSNKEFWTKVAIGDLTYPERVVLKNFSITEWLPANPGKYFTPEAASARKSALREYDELAEEFLPSGKFFMVLGGVGTLRLAPRDVRRRDVVGFGATSDGVCHRGIPLICPMDLAEKLRPRLHRCGGLIANITGSLWSLFDSDLPITFHPGIQRIFLFCEDIQVLAEAKKGQLRATVALTFDIKDRWWGQPSIVRKASNAQFTLSKGWSFASFDPVGGQSELGRTVVWLKDYVRRYGLTLQGRTQPSIFSDFDELIPHFDSPEFPLASIMSRQINSSLLRGYASELKLTVNGDVIMGDFTKYEVTGGQVGAFGEGASAREFTQNMVVSGTQVDLQALLPELTTLRNYLVAQAKEAQEFVQVGAIAEAEGAAKEGDGKGVLKALGKTGKWALDAATAIGTSVAAAAIKTGLGL